MMMFTTSSSAASRRPPVPRRARPAGWTARRAWPTRPRTGQRRPSSRARRARGSGPTPALFRYPIAEGHALVEAHQPDRLLDLLADRHEHDLHVVGHLLAG